MDPLPTCHPKYFRAFAFPAHRRVKAWMARSSAGITKDGATPTPPPSAPEETPPEVAETYAEPTREDEDEPLPVVNVEETLGDPWEETTLLGT